MRSVGLLAALLLILAGPAAADPFAPYAATAEDQADAPGPHARWFQDPANVRSAVDACLAEAMAAGAPRETCIGRASDACHSHAANQTTAGSIQCSAAERDAWDAILNERYAAAMAALDPGGQTALREAQRHWIAYRDGACAVWGEVFRGGTMARQIGADCVSRQTGRRAVDMIGVVEAATP